MVSEVARSLAGQVCMRGRPAAWAVHGCYLLLWEELKTGLLLSSFVVVLYSQKRLGMMCRDELSMNLRHIIPNTIEEINQYCLTYQSLELFCQSWEKVEMKTE